MGCFNFLIFIVVVIFTKFDLVYTITDDLDILVLVDSSDESRSEGFEKEKQFLKNFTEKILVENNQLGLFTFGRSTDVHFYLNPSSTLTALLDGIDYLWYTRGEGELGPAINTTISEGFSTLGGNRDCVPNVLLVVTHRSISTADVVRLTRLMEQFVVQPIIVDMSGEDDNGNFDKLSKSKSRVVRLKTFDALFESVDQLVDIINAHKPRSGCGVLGSWQSWTSCSVSCGDGLKFRVRECKKVVDTDKDCRVELTEDGPCKMPQCIVVLDGGWSDWNRWSTCTKTCDNGMQSRTRVCDDPVPTNGGKSCVGKDTQSRQCSAWTCPDCNRKCPSGGTLSNDCETCMCSSVSLFGRALDTTNAPVQSAKIYLKSRQNKAITTSDEWGYFNINGVCLMQETIIVVREGYSSEEYTPHAVNNTHWTVNATVVKYGI